MWEIILVFLAGLITVGLSINSIIKSNNKEKELKAKQDSLTEAQNKIIQGQTSIIQLQDKYYKEIQNKSDEVIGLQKMLQGNSKTQLDEISKIRNPIPESLNVLFTAIIDLRQEEINAVRDIIKEKYSDGRGLLPVDFMSTNVAFDKMNAFKDIGFEIKILIENQDKHLQILLTQTPMLFTGYNTTAIWSAFTMQLRDNDISITCLDVPTNNIKSNYQTPSLSDFSHSKVLITYNFFYPNSIKIGSHLTKTYMARDKEYITLNMKNISLRHKNYSIEIRSLKRIDSHTFEGTMEIK